MDRLTSYLFGLALTSIFVLTGSSTDQYRIILACILSLAVCLLFFLLKWLTLDGATAAAVVGSVTYGLGGVPAAFLLFLFFISSSLISKKSKLVVESLSHDYLLSARRNGLQVWSNGFWFTLFIMLFYLSQVDFFMVAAVGALATATADTWATELGSKRFEVETYIMDGFKRVDPGTDGGVSVPGTLAALGGSLVISLVAVFLFSFSYIALLPIFSAGFLGCFVDSYLGAKFQGSQKSFETSIFSGDLNIEVTNNFVNWASTGVGSIIALTQNLILI